MNPRNLEDRGSHLAPIDVRRRIVRAIDRSAREIARLPPRPRNARAALVQRLQRWRRQAMPLF